MPGTSDDEQPPLTTLLWSLFLGMSWTWCIGMFLPVILVREFGLAGFLVFALPNVFGAAAMGWVLRTRESSTRITENHAAACAAFSWVTIAFHVFFIAWLVPGRLAGGWAAGFFLVCFAILEAVGRKRPRNDLLSAAAAFLLSVILIACAVGYTNRHDVPAIATPPSQWADAALLSTVCIFGFALCPYLDLTFHRARQHTSRSGARFAFSLGFGLFFLLMIAFTLWYAPFLATVIRAPGALPRGFSVILALHLLAQSALTIVLHSRQVPSPTRAGMSRAEIFGVGVLAASLLVGIYVRTPRQLFNLDAGELIYRCFMGFYALVFPAYVYLCIIPGRGAAPLTRRHLFVFAGAVLIAMPMFWTGFIHQRMIWLLPGLLVVILARLAVPRREDDDRQSQMG